MEVSGARIGARGRGPGTAGSGAVNVPKCIGLGRETMGHPIQIILARQLAGYLSVPVFLVDQNGNLLFYNEPAELILGQRFDETGAMPADVWSTAFTPEDGRGKPIPPNELPLMITLATQRPAHRCFLIRGLDGAVRAVEASAIPIMGLQGDFVGAAALFWEASK
jgi:PAS domain-containing protein